jgi:hypothetical protein
MDDRRRQFLTLTAFGLALAIPARSLGQPTRILREAPSEAPAQGFDAFPPGQLAPELRNFANALEVRETARQGALTLLWLGGPASSTTPPILTVEEGRASGKLSIAERESATVPQLVVENRGKTHVLMLAGEILIGGKQDRVLREDILMPPLSGPRNVGVFCVEQGRWSGGQPGFHAQKQPMVAAPSLRSRLMDKAEQHEVWREVDRAARASGAPQTGSSYQRVYEAPAVLRQVEEAERAIDPTRIAGVLGVAVFVNSRFAGIDAFRDPGLFTREWRKLLRAWAVEAAREAPAPVDLGLLRKRAAELLGGIAGASGTAHVNVGAGRVFEFRVDGIRGAALVAEKQMVHLALM